jgi:hypothetical protein
VKADEKRLFDAMAAGLILPRDERPTPRDIGERVGMHPKRVQSICAKWARKGFYEYGVSADLGWLVEDKPAT